MFKTGVIYQSDLQRPLWCLHCSCSRIQQKFKVPSQGRDWLVRPEQWFSNGDADAEAPEGLERAVPWTPCPEVFTQQTWGRALEYAFSNEFPGDGGADTPGLGSPAEPLGWRVKAGTFWHYLPLVSKKDMSQNHHLYFPGDSPTKGLRECGQISKCSHHISGNDQQSI